LNAPTPPWWQSTTVYQIYPRSFADSNGDGVGDLPGIIGHLDYLQTLGVETLWISPFFTSPQVDFGYDVSDHYGIAPEYGTVDECRALIDAVHARGMRIVFDMVLNHTSDQHPWFLESRGSPTSAKRDYYIWREGRGARGDRPPTNWKSMLGGTGWHRDEVTGDWYWASFLPFQPDLNYRNPVVKEAMLDVVRHWLNEGVDGLRLDIFNAIFKDAAFADNPFSFRPVPSEKNPHGFFQRHDSTIDHADTLAFARELRRVVDAVPGEPRMLVGEVFGDAATLKRYCGETGDLGLHMVFLFETMQTAPTAREVRDLLRRFEEAFPEPFVPTWVLGNHDRPRFIGRHGDHGGVAKLFAALQLTARGVPFVYYGEEIGMSHHDMPLAAGLDPVAARFGYVPDWVARRLRRFGILLNRDESRRPMQWHGGENAGFSIAGALPWLPLHPHYEEVNVDAQDGDPRSLLSWYRRLFALRRVHSSLSGGRLELIETGLPKDVVGYVRDDGRERTCVLLNFAAKDRAVRLDGWGTATVASSQGVEARVPAETLTLAGHEAVVLIPAT
jgi:oligo-1,6-glucosidase/alpha-glucosidase